MKQFILEYSSEAKQDLIQIKRYIKYTLNEIEIAEKLISKILNEINKLKIHPEIFPIIDDEFIRKLELRKLIVDNYIVFYRIQNNSIQIVRIIYAKRNYINLLSNI